MAILLTGVAGFIGFHVAQALLARGDEVIGIDNLNDYYDPKLKRARLDRLQGKKGFKFYQADIADVDAVQQAVVGADIRRIVHLAAQAGVRYSLVNPFAYIRANLMGHTVMLELARNLPKCEHFVYASSSSVYGGNTKLPFAVEDRVDSPVSLYAATKKADELISHAYAHLFKFPQTGLRFFTVYGPWGRPDMALYIFTKAIFEGRPIEVFNNGDMQRDFTYIDDIVDGVIKTLDNPPPPDEQGRPYRVYNIGNNKPEPLLRLIEVLENAIGRKAEKKMLPMQPGDVKATYADISAIRRDTGFAPTTPIDVGVPRFVEWYRRYHNQI
ncbi:NAD-dependent epimerase/dehydratase family protein [uncultured Ferrovibrio sp.]|jgi:UDP-glucuronate 4-epimerase|uniref:NAD-dependent epimerase/dehydratase family protein n=1 Tax=uncultured Ferrovibrio sp. TaxID=1576913 RepID=UPI002616E955|nr:NAD-dependent epimerase/dehydratase family protein [uncultured Ferrovibrio sp.]